MSIGVFAKFFRNFTTTSRMMDSTISHVTVIGGGLAGIGVAQIAAQSRHNVVLVNESKDVLKSALEEIKASLTKIAKKKYKGNVGDEVEFVQDTLARLTFTPMEPRWSVLNADLVIEATEGNLDEQQKLFETLDKVAPEHTIFVTCRSVDAGKDVAALIQRKDRFACFHLSIPAQLMPLVEVARIRETSDETLQKLMEFAKNLGKCPVACKDTPGFIIDRLLVPYWVEAMKMAERGDATEQDIDTAMRLGAGYKMGPIELPRFLGLDLPKCLEIIKGWKARDPYYDSGDARRED